MPFIDLLVPQPNNPLTGSTLPRSGSRTNSGGFAEGRTNLSKCFLTLGRRLQRIEEQMLQEDSEEEEPPPKHTETKVESVDAEAQTEKILASIKKWESSARAETQVMYTS